MTLSVQNLYALSASDVQGAVRTAFTAQLEMSPSVHGTFFGSTGFAPGTYVPGIVDAGWCDQVASALVCSGIARSSLYGFSRTVNQAAADSWWQGQLSGPTGLAASQALTQWAFPAHCHDGAGTTFQAYLGADQANWATQLADYLTTSAFIDVDLNKLIAADPNWLATLNAAYYKLHLLDPQQEARVVAAWTAAYSQAIEQWQSYNYLTGMFNPDVWLGAANGAIGVGKDGSYCSTGSVGVPMCSYWTDYGLGVIGFLGGTPSRLGLATGAKPSNQVDGSGGGGGCFTGESPLHLHSGETIAIRTVGAAHHLLARGGVRARHTDERVVVFPHRPIPIYGINGEEPFFTAGHLFWTQDGWKAFDPAVASYENPKRAIGRLGIGDTVYRLKEGSTDYDEVRIDSFTGRIHPEGEPVYGIHLEEESTYHVHGYLVGMNYPQLTAQRLMDGFATLSDAERAMLAATLTPVMPLLRKAIGRFIEAPVARALAQQPLDPP